MKNLLYTIFLLSPLVLLAQAPLGFNYQAVARDSEGNVYTNKDISLEISLLRNFDAGPVDFTEEHFVTTNEFGLFSVQIGRGDPILGNLDAMDWANNQYFFSVSFDPEGGRNFTELGITQLLSVPYALHAKTASNASGAGTDDQLLDLNGNILSIENGNSVDLGALGAGAQTLSINGDQLSISGGNTVSLKGSDPQTLSIAGNQLTISDGNSVTLPSGGGSSPWTVEDSDISYLGGKVEINEMALTDNGDELITMTSLFGPKSGYLSINDINGAVVELSSDFNANGILGVYSNQGLPLASLQGINEPASGLLRLFNSNGDLMIRATENPSGDGIITLYGLGGDQLISMSGNIAISYGPNGNSNCMLTSLGSNTNHGYITVDDASGNDRAGMYVNASGQGVVYGDVTAAATHHPSRSDQQIVYAALSGPEAAAYIRGTATLINGKARINLPEHFRMMAITETMTIMMTPYSIKSRGLAVMDKDESGFDVGELFEGTGNYNFDWEVKAIRKGHEGFEVIQKQIKPASIMDSAIIPNNEILPLHRSRISGQ